MLTKGERAVFSALYRHKLGVHLRELSRLTGLSLPAVKKIADRGVEEKVLLAEKKGNSKFFRLDFGNADVVAVIELLENFKFRGMPRLFRDGCMEFLRSLSEKPLIVLVFGSYATGAFDESGSDIDLLLVFQRVDKTLISATENLAARIGGRIGADIQPITLQYNEFETKFLDKNDGFMEGIREQAMILIGHRLYLEMLARYLK